MVLRAMLADSLLLLVVMVAWGAQATVPWRLGATTATARERRVWRMAAFPLAFAGAVAALALANRNPDATIAGRLSPLLAAPQGQLLAVLTAAVFAAALLAGVAGDRLDLTGRRIVGGIGFAACGAAAWAMELLRAGDGPVSGGGWMAARVACRLLLLLAAGELLTAGRPRWALPAGIALLAYGALLPAVVRRILWSEGFELTAAAAALLLLAVRWLPAGLRRAALLAALVLAALFTVHAGQVSQALASGVEIQVDPPLIR